ncbi:50S ribosomal protein L1 [Candidatus Woesearchaeota archaeon]|nr:50S ribosomal protein L1 [Candidatus Woesearchaeota archaeon]
MKKETILKAVKSLRDKGPKRNFSQTFDLVINLKNLNLKKPEENVDSFIVLPFGKGKKNKICALIDDALATEAKNNCDHSITKADFAAFAGKKREIKKLATKFDFFIAQADAMPQIAATFGKFLGPKGKMPNPKGGCVVPPKVSLKPVCERLHRTVRLKTKNELAVRCAVGKEDMKDEEIAENIATVYNTVLHALPQEGNNIRSVFIKLTMGLPIKITEETNAGEAQ